MEPPGPLSMQPGPPYPTSQWQWPRLLQTPRSWQPPGHEAGPTLRSATGMHFWLTQRDPSPQRAPSGASPGSLSFRPCWGKGWDSPVIQKKK